MKYAACIVLLCLLSLPPSAGEVRAEGAGPCAADIAKFCKDVRPGGGRILKCLKEHESNLSTACREHQQEMRANVKDALQACRGDIAQFCKDVKPGGGRIVNCLREHEGQLSAVCTEQLGLQRLR